MQAIHLLLVEDDTVSAEFLAEALSSLPARVDVAGDIAGARRLAGSATHALWLVDAHLPDGDGLACLRALRSVAAKQAPALALTAGAPRAELDALCAEGFVEVLLKPVSVAQLQATVRRLLGQAATVEGMPPAVGAVARSGGKLPSWEDARALAALGGDPRSLARLRRMFLDELPSLHAQLVQAQAVGDAAAVRALVHKLRASCGFVGAARLGACVEALAGSPLDADVLRDFGFAAEDAKVGSEP